MPSLPPLSLLPNVIDSYIDIAQLVERGPWPRSRVQSPLLILSGFLRSPCESWQVGLTDNACFIRFCAGWLWFLGGLQLIAHLGLNECSGNLPLVGPPLAALTRHCLMVFEYFRRLSIICQNSSGGRARSLAVVKGSTPFFGNSPVSSG